MALHDNCIEFYTEGSTATGTFHRRKIINRMKALKERFPDDVKITENADGTACVTFPVDWVRITPKRQISDEDREILAERMKAIKQANSCK